MCSARIRYLVDRLRCCLSQRQSLLGPLRAREHRVAWFYLPLLAKCSQRQHHARGIRGSNSSAIPIGQRCETRLSSERISFLRWPSTRSSDWSKKLLSQGTLITWTSCSLPKVLMLTTSLWLPQNWSNVATSGWEKVLCSSSGSLCLSLTHSCHLRFCSQPFSPRIQFTLQDKALRSG